MAVVGSVAMTSCGTSKQLIKGELNYELPSAQTRAILYSPYEIMSKMMELTDSLGEDQISNQGDSIKIIRGIAKGITPYLTYSNKGKETDPLKNTNFLNPINKKAQKKIDVMLTATINKVKNKEGESQKYFLFTASGMDEDKYKELYKIKIEGDSLSAKPIDWIVKTENVNKIDLSGYKTTDNLPENKKTEVANSVLYWGAVVLPVENPATKGFKLIISKDIKPIETSTPAYKSNSGNDIDYDSEFD